MKWVLLHEEGMSEAQERTFERWKKEHPNNEKCFFEHQVGWSSLDSMRFWKPDMSKDPNPDLFVQREIPFVRRYWVPLLGIAACLLLTFGFFYKNLLLPVAPSGNATVVAVDTYEGGKKHFLSDGSAIYLKEGSLLEVSFSEQARNLYLKNGEAIFEVAHDASRPFTVSTDHTQVVALGTVFSVNASQEYCEVYVTEGRVKLNETSTGGNRRDPVIVNLVPELKAGQMANVPLTYIGGALQPPAVQVQPFSTEEFDSKMVWKNQIIEMVSAPLFEIIQEFNKYNEVDIFVPDSELRGIRMSVSVSPDNQQEFLDLLEMTMNVEITTTQSAIYIQPKGL